MSNKTKWKDPGIVLLIVLLVIAGFVFIWWPTDMYLMGISLVGWLMFVSLFIWLLLSIIYVFWMESIEKKQIGPSREDSINAAEESQM